MAIAPSTYYAHLADGFVSQADWDDAHLANRLLGIWRANRRLYGAEKLWIAAADGGIHVGRDQVARLMRILGIQGVRRGRHRTTTTVRDPKAPRHPDLIKRDWGAPTRPDQWWVADFTYVWTLVGFVYVSFVTDVFSRRILGWRVCTTKTTALVLSALEQALFTRRRHNITFGSLRPGSYTTQTRAASTPRSRSAKRSSRRGSRRRSAPSATPWTTPCRNRRSACTRPS